MVIKGVAVPFGHSSVDTDALAPVSGEPIAAAHGWGAALFHRWRADPAFVLNDPVYQGAPILVADADFGIGSSRETAVWALAGAGFRAILAPSFGDIFRSNCVRNGVLTAVIAPQARLRVHQYLLEHRGTELSVDLSVSVVEPLHEPIQIDGFARRVLVEGIDEFELLLELAHRTDTVLGPMPDTKGVA